MRFHVFLSSLVSVVFVDASVKILLLLMSESRLPTFPSKSLVDSRDPLKSFGHFERILWYGVSSGSRGLGGGITQRTLRVSVPP